MASGSSGSCNPGDPALINNIVDHLKSQGLFDQFRRDCLGDVDTKPAYQNLRSRVETYVSNFLGNQKWEPSLNKNQLRNNLRHQINQSGILSSGIDRVLHQVVEPKIQHVFRPQIEKVVHDYVAREEEKKKWEEERRRAEELIKTRPEPLPIKTEQSRSTKQDSPHAKPFRSLPIDLPIPISSPKTEFPSSTKTRESGSGEKLGKRPLDSSRQGKGELSKKRSTNETSGQGDTLKSREGKGLPEGKIHSPERKKVGMDQKGSSVSENKKTDPRLESARTAQESKSPVSSGQRIETDLKDVKSSVSSHVVQGQAGELKKAVSSSDHKWSDKAAKIKQEPLRAGESGEKLQVKEKSESSSKTFDHSEKHSKPTKPPKPSRSEDSAKPAKIPRKDDSPKPEKKKEDSHRPPKTSKSEDSTKPYKIPKKDDTSKSYKIPKTEDSSKTHRRDDSPKHSKVGKTEDPSKVSKLAKSEDSSRSPKVYKSDDPSRPSKMPRKEDISKTSKVTKSDLTKSSKVSKTETSKSTDSKGKSAKVGDSKVQGEVRYKSSSKSASTEESKVKKEMVSATVRSLEEKKYKEKEKEDTSKGKDDKRSKEREESEKRREEKKLKEKDVTPKTAEEKKGDEKEATSKMITEKAIKGGAAEPSSSKSKKHRGDEKKRDHKPVSNREPGDEDLDNLSVSSVHTSDLSSFDEEISSVSSSEIEDELSQQEGKKRSKSDLNDTEGSSMQMVRVSAEVQVQVKHDEAADIQGPGPVQGRVADSEDTSRPSSKSSGWEGASPGASEGRRSRRRKQVSYRKMLSGQYSDSEEEETKEERRARIAKEKEERLQRRQKARAERAQKRQQQEAGTEQATPDKSGNEEGSSTKESPQDRRKKVMEQRKQSLKEAKKEQKVLEKKRALRRRLTVNPKYMSEDFASLDFHIAGTRESAVAVEGEEPVIVKAQDEPSKPEEASLAVATPVQETTEETASKSAHVKRVPTPMNVPAKPRPRRRGAAKIQVELGKRQVQLGSYTYSFKLPKPSSANFLLCTTASIPEVLQNSQPTKPKKRRASNVGAGTAPPRPGSAQGRGRRRGSMASDKQDKGYDTSPAPPTPSPPPPRPDSAQGKRCKKSSDDTTEAQPSGSLDTTTKNIVPSSPEAPNIVSKSNAEDKDKDEVVEKPDQDPQMGKDDCVKAQKVEEEMEKSSAKASAPMAVEGKDQTVVKRGDNNVEVEATGDDNMEVDKSEAVQEDVAIVSPVEKDKARNIAKAVASTSETVLSDTSVVSASEAPKQSTVSVIATTKVEVENTTTNEKAESKDKATNDKDKEKTESKTAVESKQGDQNKKKKESSQLMEKQVADAQPEGDSKAPSTDSSLPSKDMPEDTGTPEKKATDDPKEVEPSPPMEEYEEPRTPPTPTQDEQIEYQPLNTETAYSIPIVALQPSAAEPAGTAEPSSKEEEPREYSEGEICSSDDDGGNEAKRKRSDSPASQSSSSSRSRGKEDEQKGRDRTSRETRERDEVQSTQKSRPSESTRQASEARGGKRDDGSGRPKRGRTPSPPRAYRRSPSSPRRRRSPSPSAVKGVGGREVKGGRSRRNSSPQSRRSTRRSADDDAPISKRPRRM
ncbi:biorientation of chromosomes in cell division protein 1-like 1 isoform X2 [Branchiostoma lanceolatum]|uniref:biorientation of chromosomes in cell division protein 1-like 1 isoform X2 n=1 Tax=Branchiostoma lanceolatum TaxID=7740 RepID=UPI0034562C85